MNDLKQDEKIDAGCSEDDTSPELPFLVTNWLANFGKDTTNEASTPNTEQDEALQRIRRATSEIASAFSVLGAYGTSFQPSFGSTFVRQAESRNANFSDLLRRWPSVPASHLDDLVGSVLSTNATVEANMSNNVTDINLVHQAGETTCQKKPLTGRTLGNEIIDIDDLDVSGDGIMQGKQSFLHPPVMMSPIEGTNDQQIANELQLSNTQLKHNTLHVTPSFSESSRKVSDTMRRLLDLREKYTSNKVEIGRLKQSLRVQDETKAKLDNDKSLILNDDTTNGSDKSLGELDRIKECNLSCERVIAQLNRRSDELRKEQVSYSQELKALEQQAQFWSKKCKALAMTSDGPLRPASVPLSDWSRVGGNKLMRHLMSRVHGGDHHRPGRRNIPPQVYATQSRKDIITTRLAHAFTINSHLSYPVYCLRFDRTGRYFITGADDYLVKVFYVGGAPSCRSEHSVEGRRFRCNYGANARGAVLVCSLRGHAGVINDIGVSSDNCFLATASVDGDCRIWGLKDGCPVAILRGHEGGANMVSWSSFTPYRLVTTGTDGRARLWDIREAALKRYGAFVSKRPEYQLKSPTHDDTNKNENKSLPVEGNESSETMLPPLPVRNEDTSDSVAPAAAAAALAPAGNVPPPPLPPPEVPPLPGPPPADNAGDNGAAGRQRGGNNQRNIVPGQFVANNNIDEGVKLLCQFQHGPIMNDQFHAPPGTRSRRSKVNVICVSRCPLGGHFATGSDDGICRIWEDSDDSRVCDADETFSDPLYLMSSQNIKSRFNQKRTMSGSDPLLELKGHISSITDLAYSARGDRIMSASQREGVIRIWSLGKSLANFMNKGIHKAADKDVKQVVIKLINPGSSTKSTARRKGPGNAQRTETSKVSCDVAMWTHDDSKIVSAQCILLKQSSTEIQPGTQYLFLWDSRTGQCLLGISGAHTMQCPVIIPHPTVASLVCSGGADGTMRVWDFEKGKCLFSYHNKVEFGLIENNEKGKSSGFLDGAFSPDGTSLVLTDDCGRVSIFDSLHNGSNQLARTCPLWMQEQYFANDYYELFFDSNGYCIERGSELPPHMAPRGVRVTHSGIPLPDTINESYDGLVGPLPLPVNECMWQRKHLRDQACKTWNFDNETNVTKIRNTVREYDPSSTIIIPADGGSSTSGDKRSRNGSRDNQNRSSISSSNNADSGVGADTRRTESRILSSNYRWRGYDDITRDQPADNEDEENDSDDEEFNPSAGRDSNAMEQSESDDDIGSTDEDSDTASVASEPTMYGRSRAGNEPASRVPNGRSGRGQNSRARRGQNSRARRGQNSRAGRGQNSRAGRGQNSRAGRGRNAMSGRGRNAMSGRSQNGRTQRAQRRVQRRNVGLMEIGSDDETGEEIMSTNNTPSGPFVNDYNEIGHFWRLPTARENTVNRRWLLRRESDSSYEGRKPYAPQLGDSVVYIPRAHFELMQDFPFLSPPWQQWPRGTVWPVVCCRICYMRYRFPYEDGSGGTRGSLCNSVVVILTLEVTGIPQLSESREFPWPEPKFIPPVRAHKFEVSVFENALSEYLIPELLYAARLEAIEAAGRRASLNQLQVYVPYTQDDEEVRDDNDADFRVWSMRIREVSTCSPETDPHLEGSGYNVLKIGGGDESYCDSCSPWEINLSEQSNAPRPQLTRDEIKLITEKLKALSRKPDIREHFMMAVDYARYSDYLRMVEIPMNITIILERLRQGYYGSKLAVVGDMQLVRDNCIKYNSVGNPLSTVANEMVQEFASQVLSAEEREWLLSESHAAAISNNESLQLSQPDDSIDDASSGTTSRFFVNHSSSGGTGRGPLVDGEVDEPWMRRQTQRRQSALENLPPPSSNNNSRSRQSRSTVGNSTAAGHRSTRSRDASTAAGTDVLGRIRGPDTNGQPNRASQEGSIANSGMATRSQAGRTQSQQSQSNNHTLPMNQYPNNSNRSNDRSLLRTSSQDSQQDSDSNVQSVNDPNDRTFHDSESEDGSDYSTPARIPTRQRRAASRDNQDNNDNNSDGDNDDDDQAEEEVETTTVTRSRSKRMVAGQKSSRRNQIADQTPLSEANDGGDEDRSDDSGREQLSEESGTEGPVPLNASYEESDAEVDSGESDIEDPSDLDAANVQEGKRRTRKRNAPTRSNNRQNTRSNIKRPRTETKDNDSPPRRSARTAKPTSSYQEYASDNDDDDAGNDEENNDGRIIRRSSRRAARKTADNQSPEQAPSSPEHPTRQQPKRAATKKESAPDYEKESDNESKSGGEASTRRNRSNRRAGRQKASYKEVASDDDLEYDDDDDDDDSDLDSDMDDEYSESNNGRRSGKKRSRSRAKASSSSDEDEQYQDARAKRDTKRSRDSLQPEDSVLAKLSASKPWPDIPRKLVSVVAQGVWQKMWNLDTQKIFHAPVLESYPELKKDYAKKISKPMDFRTISEQITKYRSIHSFQQDIVLVFRNCCRFNETTSFAYKYGRDLWERLDNVFRKVCHDNSIELPRRF